MPVLPSKCRLHVMIFDKKEISFKEQTNKLAEFGVSIVYLLEIDHVICECFILSLKQKLRRNDRPSCIETQVISIQNENVEIRRKEELKRFVLNRKVSIVKHIKTNNKTV